MLCLGKVRQARSINAVGTNQGSNKKTKPNMMGHKHRSLCAANQHACTANSRTCAATCSRLRVANHWSCGRQHSRQVGQHQKSLIHPVQGQRPAQHQPSSLSRPSTHQWTAAGYTLTSPSDYTTTGFRPLGHRFRGESRGTVAMRSKAPTWCLRISPRHK